MLGFNLLAKRAFAVQNVTPRVTQLLIDGKFVNSASGQTFETLNPATEEVITSVQEAGVEDVDRAVAAARRAFDDGPWRKMSGFERSGLLHKLATLVEKNADELAALESLDNGKPVTIAKAADVGLTA